MRAGIVFALFLPGPYSALPLRWCLTVCLCLPPSPQVISEWLELVRLQVRADPTSCVAVHCVAGLGRAPVLVALALMELGLKYEDAVELIRQYVFWEGIRAGDRRFQRKGQKRITLAGIHFDSLRCFYVDACH